MKVSAVAKSDLGTSAELPFYLSRPAAGFPSPADDASESLDLNELVVRHKEATFYVRVEGESMEGAGIYSGDVLVVDRAIEPVDGKIVIAAIAGELTVKRLRMRGDKCFLVPENDGFQEIECTPENECTIWGVVTYTIRKT